MDHIEGPLSFLSLEIEGQPYPHSLYIFILYFYFFSFRVYIGKETAPWWIILREEGGFLLHWLYFGVMQHVLHMQALSLDGQWENALIFSICFESMSMSNPLEESRVENDVV